MHVLVVQRPRGVTFTFTSEMQPFRMKSVIYGQDTMHFLSNQNQWARKQLAFRYCKGHLYPGIILSEPSTYGLFNASKSRAVAPHSKDVYAVDKVQYTEYFEIVNQNITIEKLTTH